MPETKSFVQSLPAQALWYVAPQHAEIRSEQLHLLQPDQLVIRTLYSALSRGTESLVWAGKVPPAEYARMRAPFMDGAFPFPVKYGYASVGQVQAGDAAFVGKLVFSLSPHQTMLVRDTHAVALIPEEIPAARAVLAANMETALNAVWDAAPGPADRIVIVGGGVVGMLVAYLCGHLPGADVTLVDINPARATTARALGVKFLLPVDAPEECDLVVHCSGSPAGLSTALSLAGEEATVLEMSWYGDQPVAAALGGAFHSRQLRLQSSQVGHVSASRRPRWNYARRLAAAIALLKDPRLDVLLAPAVSFNDLPQALSHILGPQNSMLCQLIQYE